MKIDYNQILQQLNNLLKQNGFKERFILETDSNNGHIYTYLVINNPIKEHSIEILYDDYMGEWTVGYLGSHDHISDDIPLSSIFEGYIKTVLKEKLIVVHYFDDNKKWYMTSECIIPNTIPFSFSDNELLDAIKEHYMVYSWSGEVTDKIIRCYAISEREDIESFKENLQTEYFGDFYW